LLWLAISTPEALLPFWPVRLCWWGWLLIVATCGRPLQSWSQSLAGGWTSPAPAVELVNHIVVPAGGRFGSPTGSGSASTKAAVAGTFSILLLLILRHPPQALPR